MPSVLPRVRPAPDTLLTFIFRQIFHQDFWLMFLATLTMTLMYAWRGRLRNNMFWNVRL